MFICKIIVKKRKKAELKRKYNEKGSTGQTARMIMENIIRNTRNKVP